MLVLLLFTLKVRLRLQLALQVFSGTVFPMLQFLIFVLTLGAEIMLFYYLVHHQKTVVKLLGNVKVS